jgi:hypothetical protein
VARRRSSPANLSVQMALDLISVVMGWATSLLADCVDADGPRLGFEAKSPLQLGFRHQAFLEHQIGHAPPLGEGALGDARTRLVAQRRAERDESRRRSLQIFDSLTAMRFSTPE